jgi:hypothetical protein
MITLVHFFVVKVASNKENVKFFNFTNKDYKAKILFGDMRPNLKVVFFLPCIGYFKSLG